MDIDVSKNTMQIDNNRTRRNDVSKIQSIPPIYKIKVSHLLFQHKATVCLLHYHFLKDTTYFNKKDSLYSRNMTQVTKKGKGIKNRDEQFIGDLVKISRITTWRDATLIGSTIFTLTDAATDTESAPSSRIVHSEDYNRQYLLFLVIKISQKRIHTLFLLYRFICLL